MKRDLKFVKKIHEEYLNGSTQKELDRKYKTDSYYLFKKYNLKTRTSGETKSSLRRGKNELNYKFESITNEIEAYLVGLLMADGYVSNNQIGIRLNKKDKDTLVVLKNYICKDIKLQEDNKTHSFVVSSKKACENIVKLGVLSKKTKLELHIPEMDDDLKRHFLRGFFDGDGSVFVASKTKTKKYLNANICSPTINILNEFNSLLERNGIFSNINTERRIGKKAKLPQGGYCIASQDMHRLMIRRRKDIKLLFEFMYENSNVYFNRKYNVFDSFIKQHANTEVSN